MCGVGCEGAIRINMSNYKDIMQFAYNQPENFKGQWIEAEYLPEEYTNVIACDINGESSDEREPFVAHYDSGSQLWIQLNPFDWEESEKRKVTHWMKIPKIPRTPNV